jgi:hypothetical protein
VKTVFGVIFGVALTLAIQGYQFGKSNHTVYLLDALRASSPDLLANDWFTTQTFHYRAAFGVLTRAMMQVGILESGSLVAYLALVVLFHLAWLRIDDPNFRSIATRESLAEALRRLPRVGQLCAESMFDILRWGLLWPAFAVAVAYLLRRGGARERCLAASTGLAVGAYGAIFLETNWSLELHVEHHGAGDRPNRSGADAEFVQRRKRRLPQPGVCRQTQIVVRRQVDHVPAVHHGARRLFALQDAQTPVESLGLQRAQLIAKKRQRIISHIDPFISVQILCRR